MNERIATFTDKNGEIIVSSRELHEFLESNKRYSKWFERTLGYRFIEVVDYTPYQKVHPKTIKGLLTMPSNLTYRNCIWRSTVRLWKS